MFKYRQSGISVTRMLLLLVVIALLSGLAVKMIPIYLEYFNVVSSMNSLAANYKIGEVGPDEIREKLMKRLEVNDVHHVDRKNIKIVAQVDKRIVTIEYEVREHIYWNIDVVVTFFKQVELVGN